MNEIIGGREIVLLEDSCESTGALHEGKQCGTFGLMSTFSGFIAHHFNMIEAGIISTDDIELYHILLSLRAHGWTRNLPKENFVTCVKSDDLFEESWKFVLPGYNVRSTELNAVIGLEQLKNLDGFIELRHINADYFNKVIVQSLKRHFWFQKTDDSVKSQSSWFGFSMIIKEPTAKRSRTKLVEEITNSGIECRPIVAGNFAKNQVVKDYFDYEISGQLKNAEFIDRHGLFVGNHPFHINRMIDHLASVLNKFVKDTR